MSGLPSTGISVREGASGRRANQCYFLQSGSLEKEWVGWGVYPGLKSQAVPRGLGSQRNYGLPF